MALAVALVSCAMADLPPPPTPHLTPPPAAVIAAPREVKVATSSKASSAKSRSIDTCSPCDLVPWVPMARSLALDSQHYALSVPAVPLNLPVSYGIPVTRLHPTPDHNPHLDVNYGPPTAGDSRVNTAEQLQEGKPGLPPPPLPQLAYGPPQTLTHTQHVSESNINPTSQQLFPPPPPPAYLNYQLLPSVKFGPPFHIKTPIPSNLSKPSVNYLPQNTQKPPVNKYLPQNTLPTVKHPTQNQYKTSTPSYLPHNTPPPNPGQFVNQGIPQQYKEDSLKFPFFLKNPIPFPTMSKTQLPPLFNYQTFHDGKRNQLYPFLQPPKPQNVVVTITESDDGCKKCQEQNHSSDSEPAQAEHITEHLTTTEKQETTREPSVDSPKHNIQVVKSVPLAEYLASVEYPMQIVQAPILDVPDLTKYFNFGYHNFPQVPHQQGNGFHTLQDQNPSQSFTLPNKQNAENYNHNFSFSSSSHSDQSTTNLDDVSIPEEQTTNNLPPNHKQNLQILVKNEETTDKGFTRSSILQTTDISTHKTTRPSQIYHISKLTPSNHIDSTIHTTELPSSQGAISSTGGHYVTSQPLTNQLPSSSTKPAPYQEPVHSSSQTQPLAAPSGETFPNGPVNLKFNVSPPPPSSGSLGDWALHPYGRGWGNTLPQPFGMPTNSPHRARFEVRPSPVPSKKAKHIHQIIVPYTTNNKHVSAVAQEPSNTIGWTPVPPSNQGRKVPANINIGDQFPSTTGFDQVHHYQNIGPTGDSQVSTNVPLSASGSDSISSQQILPSSSAQNYLPPHVINQILHNPSGAIWPTGSEGLQHLLTTNLQSLLRGEEDSIDITSLQKTIDNWTAEGYKQNSPSVNYIPATTISHIFNSKKIPNEYLTSTEPTAPINVQEKEDRSILYQHSGVADDNEGAASLRHQVKIQPNDPHAKDQEALKETETMTEAAKEVVTETTFKVWENVQVSISPLTKEKVYVVTPLPDTETTTTSSPI